jgi:hypothetical protein
MVLPANLATDDVIDEVWTDAVVANLTTMTPTLWVAPTLLNSWVNYGLTYQVAQYRKVGDMVQIRGTIKSGTPPSIVFNLPAGFRPPADIQLLGWSSSGTAVFSIVPNGDVTCLANTGATTHFTLLQFSTVA